MGKYDDIINMPHHVSSKHPQMARENRAAQFAPFAALTGYDASVKEEARLTGERIQLTDEQVSALNSKLAYLQDKIADEPLVVITYFVPDAKKLGGEYVTIEGIIHRIDDIEGVITLADKKKIAMTEILSIEGDVFRWDMFDD